MNIYSFYLIFLLFFIVFCLLAYYLQGNRFSKVINAITYFLFILLFLEITCVFSIYIKTKTWSFKEPYNQNIELFEPHPYLVGVPKKNVSVKIGEHIYSNNSKGFRGNEFSEKSDKKRIVVIGGSTSYGVGVNDNETWPYYLDSLLSENYEVLNAGMPGHTSAEHVIFSSLILPEYKPDIVLVHAGLNDLRNLHFDNSEPDYSDFHAPTFAGSLGFCYRNGLPRLAIIRVTISIMERLNLYPVCDFHQMKKLKLNPDNEKAAQLFERNLTTIINNCKEINAEMVFVPQVLVKDKIAGGKLKWWIPNLSDHELISYTVHFNNIMQTVAEKKGVVYVKTITENKFSAEDFGDPSHLNATGNLKFANALKEFLLAKDTLQ